MCFPNAGILEFVHYQSDWIPFYLKNNFAVVLFNYRGYGLVRNGLPSPSSIKQDAHVVLEQLVALYPSAKIMVHGESMGGMVACSLAAKYPLHVALAYVDRTFSNLPKVGSKSETQSKVVHCIILHRLHRTAPYCNCTPCSLRSMFFSSPLTPFVCTYILFLQPSCRYFVKNGFCSYLRSMDIALENQQC